MTFIDPLSLVVDLLILVVIVVFYTAVTGWLEVRRKDLVRANHQLQSGALLLGLLGGVIGIVAIWGELTWPITGFPGAEAYNLFFFDILTLLAIVLLGFWAVVRLHYPTHILGMLSVAAGLAVLFYGARAYQLGLTQTPLATLLLYVAYGAVAILAYPVTLYLDWFVIGPQHPGRDPLPSSSTPDYPWIWRILLFVFLAALVAAGVASVIFGINIVWSHLGSPP